MHSRIAFIRLLKPHDLDGPIAWMLEVKLESREYMRQKNSFTAEIMTYLSNGNLVPIYI